MLWRVLFIIHLRENYAITDKCNESVDYMLGCNHLLLVQCKNYISIDSMIKLLRWEFIHISMHANTMSVCCLTRITENLIVDMNCHLPLLYSCHPCMMTNIRWIVTANCLLLLSLVSLDKLLSIQLRMTYHTCVFTDQNRHSSNFVWPNERYARSHLLKISSAIWVFFFLAHRFTLIGIYRAMCFRNSWFVHRIE